MAASDLVELGASVRLLPVPSLAAQFGVSERSVEGFLGHLGQYGPGVKVVNGPNGIRYVSLFHLEEAVFNLFEDTTSPGDLKMARRELAGVLYGTLTQEMIKQRVREIARLIGGRRVKAPVIREPGAKKGRGRPRKEDIFGPKDVDYCCGTEGQVGAGPGHPGEAGAVHDAAVPGDKGGGHDPVPQGSPGAGENPDCGTVGVVVQ